ncbi:hypothetical protein C0Q70_21510 [Pomacea canaliculata]|uniref:Uncharacterized protein n=1 Tax=Pomacea canaliculata TaxID=400727 RepID=A0A2T7NCQ7_POMCA|nr:hypothetical protein C0Q70_21510 [Pomacea canaliculata]
MQIALTPPVSGGLSLTPLTPVVDLSFPPICAEDGTPKYEYSNYYNTYVPSKLMSQMPEMVYYVGLSQVTVRGRVDSP